MILFKLQMTAWDEVRPYSGAANRSVGQGADQSSTVGVSGMPRPGRGARRINRMRVSSDKMRPGVSLNRFKLPFRPKLLGFLRETQGLLSPLRAQSRGTSAGPSMMTVRL